MIFSVPHDGTETVEGVSERTKGVLKRDVAVSDIVRDILAFIPGEMIKGEISRRFVDYNRPAELAFENDRLREYYEKYHAEIEARLKIGGMLFDMHGFQSGIGRDFDFIISSNKGNAFLANELQLRGYRVAMNATSPDTIFKTGYTATRYSLMGILSFQVEISDNFRKKETRELGKKLSRDFAEALRVLLLFESGNSLNDFKWQREDDRIRLV